MEKPARTSACLAVDLQGKLLPRMHGHEHLLSQVEKLLQGMQILEVPVILTEQYPKGLGPTVSEVAALLKGCEPVEKDTFSCCGSTPFLEKLQHTGADHVIICGIETHVCVYQTARDLLERGYAVDVVNDCVSSRTSWNRDTALERLRDLGAGIVSMEMVLFDMLHTARGERFKAVSRLVK